MDNQNMPRVAEQADERALFEAWALRSGWEAKIIAIRDGDGYAEPFLTDYWGCWKDARATQQAAPEAPTLTDEELDDLASAYFAEEWAQKHVKNAIHDAFVIARRAPATQQAGAAVDGTVIGYGTPAATTTSAAHHFACPQRGHNPLCDGCEAESKATTASASECDREGYHAYEVYSADGKQRCTICGVEWMGWPTAPSRDAAPIKTWQEHIYEAHPRSEEAFWPHTLMCKYMVQEIADLRAALARAPLPAKEDALCPACKGSGEGVMMEGAGPDTYEVPCNCPHCNGSGGLLDAYNGVVALLAAEHEKYMQCCGKVFAASLTAPAQAGDALDAKDSARSYIDWWVSIETDVRKSMLVFAHREPERLHTLVRQAYEEGQQSVIAAMSASQGKTQEAK
jgi:hypothetical protein